MLFTASGWFHLDHRETLIEVFNRLLLLLCFIKKNYQLKVCWSNARNYKIYDLMIIKNDKPYFIE